MSTPPVTSRGLSGMLGFKVVPFLVRARSDGLPVGTDGQSTSKAPPRARLLSGHGRSGRRSLQRPLPAPAGGSAPRHAFAVSSWQGQAEADKTTPQDWSAHLWANRGKKLGNIWGYSHLLQTTTALFFGPPSHFEEVLMPTYPSSRPPPSAKRWAVSKVAPWLRWTVVA